MTLGQWLRHHRFMMGCLLRRWCRTAKRMPAALRWLWQRDARVIVHIHLVQVYPHSWFEGGTATRMLYEDAQGVLWWRAWGVLRPGVKTHRVGGRPYGSAVHVDALGGQSWTQRGPHFVCEYATNWTEVDRSK